MDVGGGEAQKAEPRVEQSVLAAIVLEQGVAVGASVVFHAEPLSSVVEIRRANGGGDTHPAPLDDVLVGEITAANGHSCPRRGTAGLGDCDFDRSAGRQVEAVQPGGGLAREGRPDREAAMESRSL